MAHLHIMRAAIKVAGVAGFVGLLVFSHFLPAIATGLRIAAIVWFFGFGIAFAILDFKFPAPPPARLVSKYDDVKCRAKDESPGVVCTAIRRRLL